MCHNFPEIESYLSGNTVLPQGFQKIAKINLFLAFLINFSPLKMSHFNFGIFQQFLSHKNDTSGNTVFNMCHNFPERK